MPEHIEHAADRRAKDIQTASGPWYRREPGLATLFAGLGVMILAFLLPQEQRALVFYPSLALLAVGTLLTLRHGPDRSGDVSR
jgi:hypothetical protein